MTSQCKKHTYVFQKNTTVTTAKISRSGTSARISFKGLYKCSVCGKEHLGQSKQVPNEKNPLNDLLNNSLNNLFEGGE